jgi:hypothetical protein
VEVWERNDGPERGWGGLQIYNRERVI